MATLHFGLAHGLVDECQQLLEEVLKTPVAGSDQFTATLEVYKKLKAGWAEPRLRCRKFAGRPGRESACSHAQTQSNS